MADNYGVDRFYAILAAIAFAGIFAALAVYPLRSYAINLQSKTEKVFRFTE